MTAAERIRAKLLDLAIRGKLVPQDMNDEPADVLLSKIRDEKERLLKEKKIKKEKPLPPITDEEKPFVLPKGWVWCRLGDVGDWKAGATPSRKIDTYYCGGTIPWLKTGDLNDDTVYSVPEYITEQAVLETSVRLNPIGSVLMAMYGATIGRVGVLGVAATTNQACCACVVADELLYNKYLFYYLMSQRNKLKALGGGGAQPNISKDIIVSYPFPLPPIAEQKRIVEKLEELLKAADTLGKCAEKFDELSDKVRAKILDLAVRGKLVPQDANDEPADVLFSKIREEKARLLKEKKIKKEKPLSPITDEEISFDLPKGWTWCRLGDVCNYGECKSEKKLPNDAWVLDLEDIEKGTGKLLSRIFAQSRQSTSSKHVFKKGMLLYSKLRTYLNKVLIADMDGYCTSEILPLDFGEMVDVRYARIVLMSPYFLNYAAGCCYGVKMPRLGTDDGCKACFPLPPLAEQKRIVAKVELMLAVCEKLKGAGA